MSLATEQTFRNAVALAEGVRQQSKAAAAITYGFVVANLAAYQIALADADAAYYQSVVTANAALDEQVGNIGLGGLIDGARWTPLLTIA